MGPSHQAASCGAERRTAQQRWQADVSIVCGAQIDELADGPYRYEAAGRWALSAFNLPKGQVRKVEAIARLVE